MAKRKRKILPVITLLVLAPLLGELLSGSSPPLEYFSPVTFILLTMLYGTGALIVREVTRRWKKGWVSILLLGMAYGIYEEGVVVRSFFDAGWPDLGLLSEYGRWMGINWIWSIALTIFHAVVSISLPIALTELLFSDQKEKLWLTNKALTTSMGIFSIFTFLGPLFGMKITFLGMLASLVTIIILVLLANNWSDTVHTQSVERDAVKEWKISFASVALMIGFIAGMWILPALSIPWVITFVLLAVLPWVGMCLYNHLGKNFWGAEHLWAAVFGLLTPWMVLGVFSELDNANRPDDTSGMILVVVFFFIFLIITRLLIWRKERRAEI